MQYIRACLRTSPDINIVNAIHKGKYSRILKRNLDYFRPLINKNISKFIVHHIYGMLSLATINHLDSSCSLKKH